MFGVSRFSTGFSNHSENQTFLSLLIPSFIYIQFVSLNNTNLVFYVYLWFMLAYMSGMSYEKYFFVELF